MEFADFVTSNRWMYDNFTVAYEGYNENLDLISFCMTHWIFESKRSKKASLALNMERTGSWSS